MFGFLFGTICLFGLGAVMRQGAWHGRYAGGCGGGRWGHHGSRRGGRGAGRFAEEGFARAAGEVFKRRLRIDEDQEAIVDHALVDLRKAVKELGDELNATRATLADAFRGESVDEAALASTFAKHDDAVGRARREVVSAFKQVHAVLDPEQRARAADAIANQQSGWM